MKKKPGKLTEEKVVDIVQVDPKTGKRDLVAQAEFDARMKKRQSGFRNFGGGVPEQERIP